MFLRNAWYVAATDKEVTRTPMRRVIMNEPIVMYRTEAGLPVALEDRCAHRHLPLSMGKLDGDILECLYHGLCFDATGACVKVPGQQTVPPGARVKAYPMVERYHWVWIWMGDPALADPAAITDFHWFDDPEWGAAQRYLHVKGNWQLVVDNLLDLTHLAFVHTSTIGNRALVDAKVKVDRTPTDVTVTRWTIDAPAPPTFVRAGGFTGNVDRWQIIHFTPPSFVRLDVGATPRCAGGPPRRRHRDAQPQRDDAGDGDHDALFLRPGARLRHPQSEDDRHGYRSGHHRLLRRPGGVRGAAAEHAAGAERAADRHQRRRWRAAGAAHYRPALRRGAGGAGAAHRGGMMWHRVAAAADVRDGEPIGVEVGDVQIALCRLDGTIYAFENVCPHAFALLSDGFVEDDEIECPLHAARFEIATGRCTSPPADRDLVTYPVRIEGEDVLVEVAE